MKSKVLLLSIMTFSLSSCFYDSEEELYPNPPACDTLNVSYSGDVVPILQNRCYSCHGNGTTVSVIEFEGHSDLLTVIANRNLLGAIKRESGVIAMPQGADKLPDCEILIIEAWIHQGKLNN